MVRQALGARTGRDANTFIVPETWGQTLQDGVKAEEVDVIPYDVTIAYEDWTYGGDISLSLLSPGAAS